MNQTPDKVRVNSM